MRVYYLLAQKTYRINLQYKFAHFINAMGSSLFGFMMIFIWKAASSSKGGIAEYTTRDLMMWVAFAQVLFNLMYPTAGLAIQRSVRSGNVSLEFLRPVSFFYYVISREGGRQIYNLAFRCVPIFLLYAATIGLGVPAPMVSLLLVPACLLGLYVSLCVSYLVGITSLWTTDIRWAQAIYFTLLNLTSGVQIPTNLLPGVFGRIMPYSPWACMIYYPCRIYLGFEGPRALIVPVAWCVIMTVVCIAVTNMGRRRMEVQGG